MQQPEVGVGNRQAPSMAQFPRLDRCHRTFSIYQTGQVSRIWDTQSQNLSPSMNPCICLASAGTKQFPLSCPAASLEALTTNDALPVLPTFRIGWRVTHLTLVVTFPRAVFSCCSLITHKSLTTSSAGNNHVDLLGST